MPNLQAGRWQWLLDFQNERTKYMNPILFLITKIRLFFAICRKKAAKKTLNSAIAISRAASGGVNDYYNRFLEISLKCERLAVEYKRLKSLKTERPLLQVCLPLGNIETSSQSEVELTKLDIETALTRHKYGDWGELSETQWLRNNNIAKSGEGIVRSCYEYHDGNRFYVDTCMPGGDTLLHLEGE